jgi:hypothetical protein
MDRDRRDITKGVIAPEPLKQMFFRKKPIQIGSKEKPSQGTCPPGSLDISRLFDIQWRHGTD